MNNDINNKKLEEIVEENFLFNQYQNNNKIKYVQSTYFLFNIY